MPSLPGIGQAWCWHVWEGRGAGASRQESEEGGTLGPELELEVPQRASTDGQTTGKDQLKVYLFLKAFLYILFQVDSREAWSVCLSG